MFKRPQIYNFHKLKKKKIGREPRNRMHKQASLQNAFFNFIIDFLFVSIS